MSGTGKSTLVGELSALGYRAVDLDDPGWFVLSPDGDRLWDEDRVQAFLSEVSGDALFIAGCAENQGKFHPQFDHIILLSAPNDVLIERLRSRTNNPSRILGADG